MHTSKLSWSLGSVSAILSFLCCVMVSPANSQGQLGEQAHIEKVKIEFRTNPRGIRAKVIYGRKTLGRTPFTLEVPRRSGFRDVRVVADGYLTLNTRFHTFKNHKRTFNLTKIEDAHTLLGYKHLPPDVGVDLGLSDQDGGLSGGSAQSLDAGVSKGPKSKSDQ